MQSPSLLCASFSRHLSARNHLLLTRYTTLCHRVCRNLRREVHEGRKLRPCPLFVVHCLRLDTRQVNPLSQVWAFLCLASSLRTGHRRPSGRPVLNSPLRSPLPAPSPQSPPAASSSPPPAHLPHHLPHT